MGTITEIALAENFGKINLGMSTQAASPTAEKSTIPTMMDRT